jgi:uncharacterized delta-60 repeat protein
MGPNIIIKSGTTSIPGATVKGDFSYFSASTLNLGPTNTTGFYSGIDAPISGCTVYQIGGPNGLNARVASNSNELNLILIGAGATGSTLNDRIIWATNTNSIFIDTGSGFTNAIVYYFGGAFTTANFVPAYRAISLNTDGSVDTSFNIGTGFGNLVWTTAIQSDGKILAGGQFTTFSGASQNDFIRLNTDGSKDTSFDIGNGFNAIVWTTAIQSDGKILVGGQFTTFSGSSQFYFIRLNSNGSKDTSLNIGTTIDNGFGGQVFTTAIQSDGKILAGGAFPGFSGQSAGRFIRLNTNGSRDTSFDIGSGFNGFAVQSSAIQSDGKILVGGDFTTFTGSTQNFFIRLNSNGSKDTSFNLGAGFDNNFEEGQFGIINSIAIQPDGKILAGGFFFGFSGVPYNSLIRFNTNGSVDTSFDSGIAFFNETVYSIAIQSDGKILVGSASGLKRLNTNGSQDTSFNIGPGANFAVYSVKIRPSEKILVGGAFTTFGGTYQYYISKTTNYLLDTSFNTGPGFTNEVNSIAIQSDGKILAGGLFNFFSGQSQNHLIRLNTDGSKDTSFNIGAGFANPSLVCSVESIAIQSDGKILAAGQYIQFAGATQRGLVRLNTDGSKDTSFNIGINGFGDGANVASVNSISIQSDGKILAGGAFITFSGLSQNNLIRLNTDGSKDTSFDIGAGFSSGFRNIFTTAIQSDGKILAGGEFTSFTGSPQNRLIRFNSNGSKDTSFNIGSGFNGPVYSIAIQSDGKILVGGSFSTYQGSTENRLIRLNSDGSKDTSFNIGSGFDSSVFSTAIQAAGTILVGGFFTVYQGVTSFRNILLDSSGGISSNSFGLNSSVNTVAIQE